MKYIDEITIKRQQKTRSYFIEKVIAKGFTDGGHKWLRLELIMQVEAETPQKAWKLVKASLGDGEYRVSNGNARSSEKLYTI